MRSEAHGPKPSRLWNLPGRATLNRPFWGNGMIAISVRELTKRFGGRPPVLDGLTFELEQGRIMGVVGPNGAGKTTLMGCLLGLVLPDAGVVEIEGKSPHDLNVRSRTGYMPERPLFDGRMTAEAILEYHHALAGQPAAQRRSDVTALLRRVDIADDARRKPVGSFSKGMLQRLGLAHALIGEPAYLFLDEPTSGLDSPGLDIVAKVIAEARSKRVTVLLNSHRFDQVERWCDVIGLVSHGKLQVVEASSIAGRRRVLRLVWMADATIDPSVLNQVAARSNSRLGRTTQNAAEFEVADDAVAALLMREVMAAGIPLVEVVPDQSRIGALVQGTDGVLS